MITVFSSRGGQIEKIALGADDPIPSDAVWIDLFDPDPAERARVEQAFGSALPTREGMSEIEPSSRLYTQDGVHVMTATALVNAEGPDPSGAPITVLLGRNRLVSIHYVQLKAIGICSDRVARSGAMSADAVMLALLEAFVDRIADVLEFASADLDEVSKRIFMKAKAGQRRPDRPDLQAALRRLGRNDDLISTARESLLSFNRVVRFVGPILEERAGAALHEVRDQLRLLREDILSLAEHAGFESNKISFLLTASLGLINMEQNNIIKIFSIVAVVLLPPTLVATIYGMNFQYMPELAWRLGYPLSLVLMVLSAILPYLYFRYRHWL
jgi:magnesium transporter